MEDVYGEDRHDPALRSRDGGTLRPDGRRYGWGGDGAVMGAAGVAAACDGSLVGRLMVVERLKEAARGQGHGQEACEKQAHTVV